MDEEMDIALAIKFAADSGVSVFRNLDILSGYAVARMKLEAISVLAGGLSKVIEERALFEQLNASSAGEP